MNQDNELDDLFKRNLEDPVNKAPFNEGDWDAFEQMLDKPKKRSGLVYWWPLLTGMAALLLLFFGWRMLEQPQTEQAPVSSPKSELTVSAPKKAKDTVNHAQQTQAGQVKKVAVPESFAVNPVKIKKAPAFSKQVSSVVPTTTTDTNLSKSQKASTAYIAGNKQPPAEKTAPVLTRPQAVEKVASNIVAKADSSPTSPKPNKTSVARVKKGFRPQFALSVLAAPDLNGVGSFQQGKVGTNEGLLFSAGISKKLTISTGVIYSVKPYLTAFNNNYGTSAQQYGNPVNVTADCRMLDIPLNINYQLYHKHQNQISVGTGLSSYIMLHQSYKFNYADTYTGSPAGYTVQGTGKYFFGVLNLNATYQHQVNSKFGISLQPYLKLPLTNIGYNQVRLQTTGIALGVTWNINSLSKP
jgi:hypothetical protein